MNYFKSLLKEKKKDFGFKKGIIPEINQKSYQSQSLLTGTIIKITKNNIYFDVGFKSLLKTKKKSFVNAFFEIEKMIHERHSNESYDIATFLKSVKVGKTYKLMVYQVKSIETGLFVNFEKTLEYAKYAILFYELEFLKKNKQQLKGYILNTVNGGFSVGLGDLIAFIPNNEISRKRANTKTTYQSNRLNTLMLDSSFNFKILNINFSRKNVVLTRDKK
jgi:ribosomal protein S1